MSLMVRLALITGIPVREWREESASVIATAVEQINERAEKSR